MEIATKHNQRQIKINTRLSLLLVSISIYKNYEPGLEVLEFCVISDECSYLALLGSFLSKFKNNRNSECQLFCCCEKSHFSLVHTSTSTRTVTYHTSNNKKV